MLFSFIPFLVVNSTTTATTSPVETTEFKRTENDSTQLDNTTIYEDSIKNNNNNSWVPFVAISLGIVVPVCVIYVLAFFYYKQGKTFFPTLMPFIAMLVMKMIYN